MKLALALHWSSVELMLNNLSYAELTDWLVFYSIEPFPEERAELRNAYAMSLLANVNRDTKKGKPFSPKDFMIDFWGMVSTEKRPSANALFEKAKLINMMVGGTIVKRQ